MTGYFEYFERKQVDCLYCLYRQQSHESFLGKQCKPNIKLKLKY